MRQRKSIVVIVLCAAAGAASAQPGGPVYRGESLGTINEAGEPTQITDNVRVFGSFRFAESCTFDSERNMILAMNAGVPQQMQENDGYVSLIHPDGRVHMSKWIGGLREGLTLNHPLGSAIHDGVLHVADIDVVRTFDLETGEPLEAHQVPDANLLNGIAVAPDGSVFASNTLPPERIYELSPDGSVSVFVDGAPLAVPNGVAIDPDGNVVVVNIANNEVLTFDRNGELIRTEHAAESGNDGLVILDDGTKYVSSVRFGSVSRIRPGQEAEVVAAGIPSAASMCYDSTQHQLVIPMNDHNALAFIELED